MSRARLSAIGVLLLAGVPVLGCQAGAARPVLGFWFDDRPLILPTEAASRLGGSLTAADLESIRRVSRAEIDRAFAGLKVAITDSRTAFWRIEVVPALPGRGPHPLPNSGESLALGPFGGSGGVDFEIVALYAARYAAPNALRQTVIDGIGRGIGRVAAHEFAHEILGGAMAHNPADVDSYEYPSPARASQYYGELHWTSAWPALRQRFDGR